MGAFVIVTELSDLLNGTGISARKAAEKATELGVDLPYGTIAAYWTRKHPSPSEKTLEGLSEVLSLSLRRLRRAAGKAAGEADPWHPPSEANRLTRRQRDALDQLIKAIVEAPPQSDASPQADQDKEASDGAKTPLVFRTGERTTPSEHRANEG